MGHYTNTGKQVLFVDGETRRHIADAAGNEEAHFLAYHANGANFISNALRTLSASWHGDKVAKSHFVAALNEAIKAANALDKIKKTLFYGRDNNIEARLGEANLYGLPQMLVPVYGPMAARRENDHANIIHGIIGKFTEAGELLEALKAWINGAPLDRVNIIEEIGDGFWYDAILLDELSSDFGDAQGRVIAKLRARFPDKFAEVNANVRDLEAERAILEQGSQPAYIDPAPAPAGGMTYEQARMMLDHEQYEADPLNPNREPPTHEEIMRYMATAGDAVTLTTGDTATTEPGIMLDENGGDYAPTEAEAAARPLIHEAAPASGKEAVEAAASSAAKAFDALANVGAKVEPAPPVNTGELHKAPSERLHPLPQEGMAQSNNGRKR